MEYNETFQVVLMENSSRLEVDSSRTTTQVTIVEDDDGKTSVLRSVNCCCVGINLVQACRIEIENLRYQLL